MLGWSHDVAERRYKHLEAATSMKTIDYYADLLVAAFWKGCGSTLQLHSCSSRSRATSLSYVPLGWARGRPLRFSLYSSQFQSVLSITYQQGETLRSIFFAVMQTLKERGYDFLESPNTQGSYITMPDLIMTLSEDTEGYRGW